MRLVEVVMLMGAHCVSPVEHTPMMTDAAKVQCAVVIEKDTDAGTVKVTPGDAASDPQVMAAIERFRLAPSDPLTAAGTKIVPAWAPAGSPAVEVKPPVAKAVTVPEPIAPPADEVASADPVPVPPPPLAVQSPPPAAPAKAAVSTKSAAPAPAPERKVATLSAPPQKRPPAREPAVKKQPAVAKAAAATPQSSSQCKGAAVAKWYKTADGKRKYRCVKPAGDSAPDQLY